MLMKKFRICLFNFMLFPAVLSSALPNTHPGICVYIISAEGETASIFLLPESDLLNAEREKSSGKQFPAIGELIKNAKSLINSPKNALFLSDLIYHKETKAPEMVGEWIFKMATVEYVDKKRRGVTEPEYSTVLLLEFLFQSDSPEPVFAKIFLLENGTSIFRTTQSAKELFD